MIYFKIFYDMIYNINKINEDNSTLKINKLSKNNNELIIIYLNKKNEYYNEIFNHLYNSVKISKKDLNFILSNIHITIWKNPWIKCSGSFDISGKMPNNTEFKIWYSLKEKKYTNVDENEYYIRSIEPNKCEYIFSNKNIGTNNENLKKLYTKIKNILFNEIKDIIYYVDYEF